MGKVRLLSGVNLKLHCIINVPGAGLIKGRGPVILTSLSNVTTRHRRVLICGCKQKQFARLLGIYSIRTIESIAARLHDGIEFNEFETGYECDHANIM